MKDGVCPKCGSQRVVPELQLVGYLWAESQLAFHEKPGGLFSSQPHYAPVKAWLCGECGYVEFYASNMKYLVKAHERLQRKRAAEQAPVDEIR